MEINEIVTQLKDKFGDKVNVAKVTEILKGSDHSKMSFTEIVEKVKGGLGDLDGDGKKENAFAEIAGKVGSTFSHMFGK